MDIFDFIRDGRYITAHYWDSAEPCLLACETKTCDNEELQTERETTDRMLSVKKSINEIRKAVSR